MQLFVNTSYHDAGGTHTRKVGFASSDVDYFTETSQTDVTLVVLKTGSTFYVQLTPKDFYDTMRLAERQDRYYYKNVNN